MSTPRSRTIKVEQLARVEGEGAFYVKVRAGKVEDARLEIFEPPRFFEAFLRGRRFTEAPDITARICGICPVAYQMSAVHAMEQICGVTVIPTAIRTSGISCTAANGSRATHCTSSCFTCRTSSAYEDAVAMAKEHPGSGADCAEASRRRATIMQLLGGREIHPINVRVGRILPRSVAAGDAGAA
jgi:sulfhydrogenase subunit alpha